MLDTIALIQSLTLPAGALTGARIELDGTLGEIRVYDSNGKLRIRIANSGAGAVELFGGDTLEVVSGIIQELVSGAGGTRQLDLFLAPGIFQGGNRPTIDLLSDSQDGTVPGSIKYFSPNIHSFNPAGNGEILLNGKSLPRGRVDSSHRASNSGTFTAETDITNMTVSWTAISTRRYRTTIFARGMASDANPAQGKAFIADASNAHIAEINIDTVRANVVTGPVLLQAEETGLSGATTRKLRVSMGAGNGTLAMSPDSFVLVEDIGGV